MNAVDAAEPRTMRGRPRDRSETLRSAAVVLVLGVLTVAVFYFPIRHLQAHDASAPAETMKSMRMYRLNVFWSFPLLQAAGFAALIWAYLGLCLGLLEAGPTGRWRWLPLSSAARVRLHRHISLLVLGLILVHAVATAFDAMGDNLLTAFVPWEEGYKPVVFSFVLGIFALYLALLVGPTYYVRRRIGVKRWQIVHRLAGVVYVLALWHTLIVGDDVAYYSWVHPLIWLLQIPLLALFVQRLLGQARVLRAREAARLELGEALLSRAQLTRATCLTLAGVGALAIVGVVVLVATGAYQSIVASNAF
ncbi:MAG TPA: ferric reductase-like transmembrane domain-containing protein [Solirubrobacteraceae bacterium]|nr:ferric reductase-like transmembrane domain-containing protein [Solirubrobacteraceae bacterium]